MIDISHKIIANKFCQCHVAGEEELGGGGAEFELWQSGEIFCLNNVLFILLITGFVYFSFRS